MGSRTMWRFLVGPALFGTALAGAFGAERATDPVVFRHKIHLDEGLECSDCHDATKQPPVLDKEICTDCHDDAPDHYRLPVATARLPFTFRHAQHARKLDCLTCHRSTVREKQVAGALLVEYDTCEACHTRRGGPVQTRRCARCHGEDQARVRPSDHRVAWLDRHGRESRWRSKKQHGASCTLCHRVDTCHTCHRTRRPRSHTALWRLRLHGYEAAWDRESCKTCHETGTCVQCHRITKPQNHTGSWRSVHPVVAQSTGNETCLVCHTTRFCAGCHGGS